ncbi:hypothetical protein AVEN_255590-1 [Araneus ventricosus]|uniref:Uncharacterized protein n=1 Tax=Araneus ventricosus TaxID=182803 RepID=A0A4Y2L5N3_ARAVE|nr:hypothetical protein AVEN_255590-1 [Araneus ventricosus]
MIDEVKSEVKGKIEEVEHKVQGKIGDIERRLSELEDRPFSFSFDVVSSTKGWTDCVKASQLVASLRESAAEVLQGIPADKLTDLTTIEKAL